MYRLKRPKECMENIFDERGRGTDQSSSTCGADELKIYMQHHRYCQIPICLYMAKVIQKAETNNLGTIQIV